MNYDDPKLTAYALGEGDEAMQLDDGAARIVEETMLIASVLTTHFGRARRRGRVINYAMAASVVLAGIAIFVLSYRPERRPAVAVAPVEQPVVQVQTNGTPILRFTPALAEASQASSIANASFRGIRALDVEQLVALVIEDASRVGAFTSLRLTPELAVAFQ
jgi:hypothetical protein